MTRRRVSNLFALAVLACLGEREMHPYELAAVLKRRAKEKSIKINYGSLYTVVEALTRAGFVEPVETQRSGRRPERTVYALTAAGREELRDWLHDIFGTPKKEFPEFEAGLSLMSVLPPDEVSELLRERIRRLRARLDETDEFFRWAIGHGLWRLFRIEVEYERALLEAELAWVSRLVEELEDGTFDDLAAWRLYHEPVGTDDAV